MNKEQLWEQLEAVSGNGCQDFWCGVSSLFTFDVSDTLKPLYIYLIRKWVDPNHVSPDFLTELSGLNTQDLYVGYRVLFNSACKTEDSDTAFSLACLTTLDFVDLENGNQPLSIAPIINKALKVRIISEVNNIVGFTYTGKDAQGDALPVLVGELEIPWDDVQITARKLFEGIPFVYNRQNAAAKAIAMANGTDNIIDDFASSGTDSGRFVSLAFHAGGLPMTVRPNETDCMTGLTDSPLQSWCAKAVNSQYEANRTWLVHSSQHDNENAQIANLYDNQRLIGYLLGNTDVLGEGIRFRDAGAYEVLSVEEVIGTPSEIRTDGPSTITSFGNSTRLPLASGPVYDVYGNAGFIGRIEQAMLLLSNFEIGDYIFTGGNDPTKEHGFIIVDKRECIQCDDLTEISETQVFWVADLPGTQVGTPRPFYCSRLFDNVTEDWFAARFWYFIKVPNLIWVNFNRLYKNDPL